MNDKSSFIGGFGMQPFYCTKCGQRLGLEPHVCNIGSFLPLEQLGKPVEAKPNKTISALAQLYPKYHKDVTTLDSIDVYMVHHLFNVQDPSGAIQHASKKLLLSGVRTGGKSKYDDIREARDTLNRWLEINKDTK